MKARRNSPIIMAALGIVVLFGATAGGAKALVASGDPATDFDAIQAALNAGGEVILENGPNGEIFNLEGIEKSLSIKRDVVLKGRYDAAGNMAKVVASNFAMVASPWGESSAAIEVNEPGVVVGFDNLNLESTVSWLIVAHRCRDFRLTNCRIKDVGTTGTIAYASFEGIAGTGYFEGNTINCAWGIMDFPTSGAESSTYEFYSNNIECFAGNDIALGTVAGVTIEDNRLGGPVPVYLAGICGQIVINNNSIIQSGHQEYPPGSGANNAYAVTASHLEGYGGGQISGNTIEMNPSDDVPIYWAPAICLADWMVFGRGEDLVVQDNKVMGTGTFAVFAGHGASHNIIRRNNFADFTVVQHGPYGPSHIALGPACHDNVCRDNAIGAVGPGEEAAGIWCAGYDNDLTRNDYTQSAIPGLTAGVVPCVRLAVFLDHDTGEYVGEARGNLVCQPDGLPAGTGITEQVLDETDNGTNMIVGP
jgi:hypothetical protein